MEELIPESYYTVNNEIIDFHAKFEQQDDEIFGFSSNEVIPENSLLVVDPTAIRLWGTYYGGPNGEIGDVGAAEYGNVFITGWTDSFTNIASAGSYKDTLSVITTMASLQSSTLPEGGYGELTSEIPLRII